MFSDDRPIFLQLADGLASDILRGTYAEGDAVPSTNELAAFYRINPATAGKALNQLVDQRVLEKRRGIGMFVAQGALEQLRAQRQASFVEQHVKPMLAEAEVLQLTTEDLIRLIHTERNSS